MGYKEGDFPVTEAVAKTTVALPFYNNLTEKEIDYVVEKLKEAISMA
ncbi:MAG: perosamine synthetase [Tepidanaerobacteraceae bacterium]|nr:perosamine synthetase [Tepidanaerobacteraceae bacterium]